LTFSLSVVHIPCEPPLVDLKLCVFGDFCRERARRLDRNLMLIRL